MKIEQEKHVHVKRMKNKKQAARTLQIDIQNTTFYLFVFHFFCLKRTSSRHAYTRKLNIIQHITILTRNASYHAVFILISAFS